MNILRVRLKDFRGVLDEEVVIAPVGVTIIEGPNEIGKTSVALGLDLIFSEFDSSSKQFIKSYRPIGRDVGPEVEVELTAGEYHVVFAKRWLKGPSTSLRVMAPSPEDHAGRPAHDRMMEILAANVDMDLWRALRYQQGQAITQASVNTSPSLQAALDASSGRVEDTQGSEIQLWSLVEQERQRYVTPSTGRPVADRIRQAESLTSQMAKVDELSASVEELEESADRLSGLRSRVGQLEEMRTTQRNEVADLIAKQRKIEDATNRVDQLAAHVRSAESERELYSTRVDERRRQIEAVDDAKGAYVELEDGRSSELSALNLAQGEEAGARESRDEVQTRLVEVRKQSAQSQSDVDYFRKTIRVRLLGERIEKIDEAISKSIAAQEFVASNSLDQVVFDQLTDVYQSVIELRAALNAEHPPIMVRALSDLTIEANGDEISMAKDESRELSAGRELNIVFPNVAEVQFSGSASAEERRDELDAALGAFDGLLLQAGVSGEDPMRQARELLVERRRNEQVIEEARIMLDTHLEGQTPEMIRAEFSLLGSEVSTYKSASRDGALPSSQDEASEIRDQLLQRIDELVADESSTKSRLETAVTAHQELLVASARSSERISQARETLQSSEAQLLSARSERADKDLDMSLTTAETALSEAKENLRQETDALAELDPETVAGFLVNSRDVSARLDENIELAKDDVRRIELLLSLKGEAGLHDLLGAANGELQSLRRRKDQIDRQARAIERLYSVMARHREDTKSAHVAPLKAAIEKLGRYVFGSTLSVEIDRETLSIVSRSIDGVAVPFDGLSGGAKEQVSMIARLACAQMVSGSEGSGVPIIIDDALGNSDPDRLATLGAVIAAAGRDSQVIVLTCVPDRFRNVGAATVLSLSNN